MALPSWITRVGAQLLGFASRRLADNLAARLDGDDPGERQLHRRLAQDLDRLERHLNTLRRSGADNAAFFLKRGISLMGLPQPEDDERRALRASAVKDDFRRADEKAGDAFTVVPTPADQVIVTRIQVTAVIYLHHGLEGDFDLARLKIDAALERLWQSPGIQACAQNCAGAVSGDTWASLLHLFRIGHDERLAVLGDVAALAVTVDDYLRDQSPDSGVREIGLKGASLFPYELFSMAVISSGEPRTLRPPDPCQVRSFALGDGHLFCTSTDIISGQVEMWSLPGEHHSIVAEGRRVTSLAFNNGLLCCGGERIELFEMQRGTPMQRGTLGEPGLKVHALAVSDGRLFAGCSGSRQEKHACIRAVDLKSKSESREFAEDFAEDLDFAEDFRLPLHRHPWLLAAGPNRLYSSVHGSPYVEVWDTKDGSLISSFLHGPSTVSPLPLAHWVTSLLCAANLNLLCSGGSAGSIHIWDLGSHACIRALNGLACWNPLGCVSAGCVSALAAVDSNTLFSGAQDGTIKIWDRRCEVSIATAHNGNCSVRALAYDQGTLFAGFEDGSVKAWLGAGPSLRQANS